jgi:glucokinase
VGALAHQGDDAALTAFARFGEQLGRGLAVLVDILNPERILIGGIYPRARPWIEPAMLASLEREALSPALSACEVMPAELGERIGDLAAIAVAAYWSEKQ